MQRDSAFGLFRGPQRTLSTAISVDECVRRLRDEVGTSMRAFFGWRPLAHCPTVWRKLRSDHVLFVKDMAGRNQWVFYSQVVSHAGTTLITGRYRMPTAMWVLFGLLVCYGLYLVIGSLLAVPVFDLERPAGWRVISPRESIVGGILPVFFLGLYALINAIQRTKHRTEEQEILQAVKQLLEAVEVEQN